MKSRKQATTLILHADRISSAINSGYELITRIFTGKTNMEEVENIKHKRDMTPACKEHTEETLKTIIPQSQK